ELLYYTRDEGQLMRRSRSVHLLLDLDPAHHLKYPGHSARMASMLQAFANRCASDLFTLFESDALWIRLGVHGPSSNEVARLWQIRHEAGIARNEIVASTLPDLPDFDTTPSRLVVPGRLTSAVYMGPKPAPDEQTRRQHLRTGLGLYWI